MDPHSGWYNAFCVHRVRGLATGFQDPGSIRRIDATEYGCFLIRSCETCHLDMPVSVAFFSRRKVNRTHSIIWCDRKENRLFSILRLFQSFLYQMVANEHYRRLKHLYTASVEETPRRVDLSYGYAEIDGVVEESSSTELTSRLPHQRLLSDVAGLAASSVEKDGLLSLEHFNLSVNKPEFRGQVTAMAEVVVAEPPRYHVRATLSDAEGEFVAEAIALFEPSGEELPPDPAPEADEEDTPTPPPAPFMPIHVTEQGVLCLN